MNRRPAGGSEGQSLAGDAVGDAGHVNRAVVAPVQAGDADEGAQFLAHSFLFASGGLKKKSRLGEESALLCGPWSGRGGGVMVAGSAAPQSTPAHGEAWQRL